MNYDPSKFKQLRTSYKQRATQNERKKAARERHNEFARQWFGKRYNEAVVTFLKKHPAEAIEILRRYIDSQPEP